MRIQLIPLGEIKVDQAKNPRKEVDNAATKELEESIKSVYALSGTHKTLLQPIVVRPIKDDSYTYELRFGFRRYAAMKNLWTSNPKERPWANKIPALIDDHDEEDEQNVSPLAFALIENVQRESMSPMDEAMAIDMMIHDFKMKQKDIAPLLGKSKGWVSQRLKLMNLAYEVREALAAGKIGHAAARQLSKLEDQETQADLLKEGLKEGWQEEDWTREANRERRKERADESDSQDQPQEEGNTPPEKPAAPTKTAPPTHAGGFSVRRAPAVIKMTQEQAEFEGHETEYEAGVSAALLWVLGLGPHPITDEEDPVEDD